MSTFPAIRELVPHGDGILQLERMIDWAPGRAECVMRVAASSRLVAADALESVLLLEPMAQAVACCLGYEAYRAGEGARIGMVVACRALRTSVPSVPVGAELCIRVARVRGNDSTSHFDCEVLWDEKAIATATLTLVHERRR
jgi:predicted hotdog family 3-hydroxylacyl-ACP dehydratase